MMNHKDTKAQRNIPKLRFPEFDGGWEECRLRKAIVSMDAGVSVNSIDRAAQQEEKGVLKTSCVTNGVFEKRENKAVIERSEISRLKEPVQGETIIMSRMNTPALVGANAYVSEDIPNIFLPDRLWALKVSQNTSAKFLAQFLSGKRMRQKISNLATGTSGSMKNITKGDVLSISVQLPHSLEQQKIADFLTAVDKRIEQLEEKKRLLTEYKKGVMQQIFSRQIRFADDNGNPYPDWEEKQLGDIATKTSSSLAANELEDSEGVYPVFGASGFLQSLNFYDEDEAYIAIVKDGAGVGRLLLCAPYTSVLGTLDKVKPMKMVHIGFLFACMSRIHFPKYVIGSTIPHIYFKDYAKENLLLPCLEEQQKIADFLTSIDNKIEQVDLQLEQAKTFKKGLLQQMFV